VDGNVQADGHALVVVNPNSTVGGSIQINQGGSARVDQVRINGDLQLKQNNGNFVLSGNVIGGNLQANQNRGTGLTIENNRITNPSYCSKPNSSSSGASM
jgi:hypothetical protein